VRLLKSNGNDPNLLISSHVRSTVLSNWNTGNTPNFRVPSVSQHPVVASSPKYLVPLLSMLQISLHLLSVLSSRVHFLLPSSHCSIRGALLQHIPSPQSTCNILSGNSASCLVDLKSRFCRAINPSCSQASLLRHLFLHPRCNH
jgi:hypothetical protein